MEKNHVVSILLLLCALSPICVVSASKAPSIFPENIDRIRSEYVFDYSFNYDVNPYAFTIEENRDYHILGMNKEKNTFLIEYINEMKLIDFKWINPVGIDVTYNNGTIIRFPFTRNRSFTSSVVREVDLFDGKILSVNNFQNMIDNVVFVFKYENDSEEQTFMSLSEGVGEIGDVPFLWYSKYENIDSALFPITTKAGNFDCFQINSEYEDNSGYWRYTYENYHDSTSGVGIIHRTEGTAGSNAELLGVDNTLLKEWKVSEINVGRGWDSLIVHASGSTNTESIIGTIENVWFMVKYAYDDVIFDESKGTVYINNEEAIWNSLKSRWEIELTSNSPDIVAYSVSSIDDAWLGVTEITQEMDDVTIEWNKTGIPSYPLVSILVGVGVFLYQRRRL
jgi:hypothetical protein